MDTPYFEIESDVPFSESVIWQLNKSFYQNEGIGAWKEGSVPHSTTNNSSVGYSYAQLIFGFLNDLAAQKKTQEQVYILELGAGHGRLSFHILGHLTKLIAKSKVRLPSYCYVLTDFVDENLSFYENHPQFKTYFESGVLDFAFWDATKSTEVFLLRSKQQIKYQDLDLPIFVIANYFFDSLPNDLFFVKESELSSCNVTVRSKKDPSTLTQMEQLDHLELTYQKSKVRFPFYKQDVWNKILLEYSLLDEESYIYFPKTAIDCLSKINALSKKGMVLLTMDKGYHTIEELVGKDEPDLVTHGSFSLWVNFHALKEYFNFNKGKILFSDLSNFNLEIGCLIMSENPNQFPLLEAAFNEYINKFSPQDYNNFKNMIYMHSNELAIKDLISVYKFSSYDSSIFINLLPVLKKQIHQVTVPQRERLGQMLDRVWELYFNVDERIDLAYEIGGLCYDLAYYSRAIEYFQYSVDRQGMQADVLYNQALCYYQLRKDEQFYEALNQAKVMFPESEIFGNLEKLDMG